MTVAFGRINGYKINPNQELIAIGVTNSAYVVQLHDSRR